MPLFEYTTVDAAGHELTERIEAEDERSAASELRGRQTLVLTLRQASPAGEGKGDPYELSLFDVFSSIGVADLALFFRQLSSLINSGITLVNALYVLEEQVKKRRLRKMIGRICMDIQGGSSLVEALNRFSKVFDERVRGMVAAGEASGTLGTMLERIADHLEEDAAFRNQLISGAIYPTLVILVVIAVVAFLVAFVIPRMTPLLKFRAQRLPWNTQVVIDVSNWFKIYWIHLFSGIAFALAAMFLSYRWLGGLRYWVDRLKIRVPLIGPVFYYSVVVQFTRNLSTLIGSGVNMLDSLRIVRDILRNEAAKKVLDTIEAHILRGENLSAPIKAADYLFPPMVASMVAVGEETGSVDSSLAIAADIHEKMLKTYIQRMTALVEPVLIVFLGAVVGFVAIALISGILTMYRV
ncbi:MAG: type II secretion system F family protein [Desulfobacteraceae bacterium]|jgi:type IV pilus assembly protein PilC